MPAYPNLSMAVRPMMARRPCFLKAATSGSWCHSSPGVTVPWRWQVQTDESWDPHSVDGFLVAELWMAGVSPTETTLRNRKWPRTRPRLTLWINPVVFHCSPEVWRWKIQGRWICKADGSPAKIANLLSTCLDTRTWMSACLSGQTKWAVVQLFRPTPD